MLPRRSTRLNKISPKNDRPDPEPPKKEEKVPPLIPHHTMSSLHAHFGRMDGKIFANQARISEMEYKVGKMESAQNDMKRKFDDAIELMNLKILGLNHKHEAYKEKSEESRNHLYVGQKKIYKALVEMAGGGEGPRAAAGQAQQNITDTSDPPRLTHRHRRGIKCELCHEASKSSNWT